MKRKIVTIMTAASFQDWKFLTSRQGGDDEYMEGSAILPIMVFGKFMGLASGILVWGLLADRRDWFVVKLTFPAILIVTVLHGVMIPQHGHTAAGWLYGLGELLLFAVCLAGFTWVQRLSGASSK